MTTAMLGLPAHLKTRLAKALATEMLEDPSPADLRVHLGPAADVDGVAEELSLLSRRGIRGRGAAAWIETLGQTLQSESRPDLVWSGPEIEGLHARDTRAVYEELLGRASHSLWVSSYAYFDGPRAFETLARRMDDQADLKVTLFLNLRRKRGDTTKASDLVREFADTLWKKDWPGSSRPHVYYDPRSLDLDGPSGVLHAKAVVADLESVFVTSANLTEAALDRNIELGLLVRDHALALSVVRHFQVLIEREELRALPMK